ncbi:MAG: alpha/beta fold hydrolase, partial [Candidatus Hydrogenedentales bacterium]
WIIFPEGGMVKDKKVVDHQGMFRVYSQSGRRPPHTGAAVLALRAQYYRERLACFLERPGMEHVVKTLLERFGLESIDEALHKRTVLVPVNITYFPIRSQENVVLRLARAMSKDLSRRATEELAFEGTVLSKDTDVDITFGDPIVVADYFQSPDCPVFLDAVQDNLNAMEEDPESGFNEAARRLMIRYMAEIYRNTTVNYDHIFGTLIRYQRARKFTERAYRNRIFLCVHQIKQLGHHRLHHVLDRSYRDILYEDASPMYGDFLDLCVREGMLRREGDAYVRVAQSQKEADFQTARSTELTTVIANEVEPLTLLTGIIRNVAQTPRSVLSSKIRAIMLQEDLDIFESDYAEFAIAGESKPPEVGRPFLLIPPRYKAGIVLVHGYMSAPLEVRALAEFLYGRGYAVYGVRVRGHGTSPENLARTQWEDWYESVNRGYAIVKSLTDNIILGGFSTGGVLALLAAGRKRDKIRAAFSINAPMQLRRYMARFASTLVSMNNLAAYIKRGSTGWEFVENHPENRHINYFRNPLVGVKELGEAMDAMEPVLKDICVPTLVIQGYRDPIVDPSSGESIFRRIGTSDKELTFFDRGRHGIVNGEGAREVYDRVDRFLMWAEQKRTANITAIASAASAADAATDQAATLKSIPSSQAS